MSEETVPEETQREESVSPTPETKKPARRRSWWRRWLRRLVVGGVILILVARVSCRWWLPPLVDELAQGQGLRVQYEDLHMALLMGDVQLRGLQAWPTDGSSEQPLLELDHLRVDVDVSALLFDFELRVARVEVDGVRAELTRDAEGRLSLPEPPEPAEEEPEEEEEEPAEPDSPAIDFGLPVFVDAVRVHDVVLRWKDEAVAPAVELELNVDVQVDALGTPEGRFAVELHSPQCLEVLRVDGRVAGALRQLDLAVGVEASGIDPAALEGYLSPLGVELAPSTWALLAALEIEFQPLATDETSTTGALRIPEARLSCVTPDGAVDPLSLQGLEVAVQTLDLEAAGGVKVDLGEVRVGELERGADGSFAFAAARWRPGAASPPSTSTTEPSPGPEASPAPGSDEAAEPFALALEEIGMRAFEFELLDRAARPETRLSYALDTLSITGPGLDLEKTDAPIHLAFQLQGTGVDAMGIEGDIVPQGREPRADLRLTVEMGELAELEPYLAAAGLEPEPGARRIGGRLQARMIEEDAVQRFELSFEDFAVAPQGEDAAAWLGLESFRVEGGLSEPEAGPLLRIDELELRGPKARLHRDEQGRWHALGFAFVPADPSRLVAAPTAASSAPSALDSSEESTEAPAPAELDEDGRPPLRLELARLHFHGVHFELVDRWADPPQRRVFDEAELLLQDFAMGGDPAAHQTSHAQLEFTSRIEELVGAFRMDGTIVSRPGPLDVETTLSWSAEEVETTAAQHWLDELGIEAEFTKARTEGQAAAVVREVERGTELSASIEQLRWEGDGVELAAVDRLELETSILGAEGTELGAVRCEGVRLRASRDEEGVLAVAGLRFVEPKAAPAAPAPPASTPAPAPPPSAEPPPAPAARRQIPAIALAGVDVSGLRVDWSDAAVEPAVSTSLELGLKLSEFSTRSEEASTLTLSGEVAGIVRRLAVEGTVQAGEEVHADLSLAIEGICSDALAGYLPEAQRPEWKDVDLRAGLAVHQRPHEEGGDHIAAEITGVELREASASGPWLALQSLELVADRVDPGAEVFQVSRLKSEGLELLLETDGPTLYGFGMQLASAAVMEDAASVGVDELRPAQAEPPAVDETGTARPPELPDSSPRPLAVLPTVELGVVSLGIDHLRIVDRSGDVPTVDTSVELELSPNQTWLQPEPEQLPPWGLTLRASVQPLMESVELKLRAEPFAPQPSLAWTLDGRGLRGETLSALLADWVPGLSGDDLQGGAFHAEFETVAEVRRRSPMEIDLLRGIGAELWLRDVWFRAQEDGPVLAGLDALYVDVRRYAVETGDLHVATVEITRPQGHVHQDEQGLHVLGLTLAPPPEEEAREEEPAPALESPPAEPPPAEPEPTAVADAAPEGAAPEAPALPAETAARGGLKVRVDHVLVNGAEFSFLDSSVEPPLSLPIDDIDVDLRGVSTEPGATMRFRVSADAGKIELPERIDSSYLAVDLLSAAARAALGQDDEVVIEERPWFGELVLQGRAGFAEQPDIFARLGLQGLEVQTLRGTAREAGVEIGDGLLDLQADVRVQGEKLQVDSLTVFRELSVSEPADGPIATYLRLPAPLDSVLFLLRNDKAEQRIPLKFEATTAGVGSGAIAKAATTALVSTIADAITSSPARLAGPLEMLDPRRLLESRDRPEFDPTPVSLSFGPASTVLHDEDRARIAELARRMRGDARARVELVHTVGGGDRKRVAQLANPHPDTCRAMVDRLRKRRQGLWIEREQLLFDARAERTDGGGENDARDELVALDRELRKTEQSLDETLALLRPGAERSSGRRTREACLRLAQTRLELLRDALAEAGVSAGRVVIKRPRYIEAEGDEGGVVRLLPSIPRTAR